MSVHQDSCGILDKSNIDNSSNNDELVSLTLCIKSASVRNHDSSIVKVHTNSHESVADVKNKVQLALGDVPKNRPILEINLQGTLVGTRHVTCSTRLWIARWRHRPCGLGRSWSSVRYVILRFGVLMHYMTWM